MASALSVTQPAGTCSDHELVAAVRRGSDRAFEELFSRYRGRIRSYVFGMVGDHARAEDIAQEVFISALRRLKDTEHPIAFKPWIYEIAKNACIDEFRRTRRAREVPLEHDDDSGAARTELVGASTPDSAVENKQRLDDLRGAFRGLSESHHRIIVMREFEGLSYGQIGERMGMSKPMVESTLFRARKKLGEEYDEIVSGRRCERVQSVIASEQQSARRMLGIRDRRQLARHLSHCQPCRRYARLAGVDESYFQTPGLIGKIAALLPIPWLRWRRSHRGGEDPVVVPGAHQLAALQSLQGVARVVDPSAPSYGLGRAAAAAAALAIAGAGGGLVTGLAGHGPAHKLRAGSPAHHRSAPAGASRMSVTVSRLPRSASTARRISSRRIRGAGGGGGAGRASAGSAATTSGATGSGAGSSAGAPTAGIANATGTALQTSQSATSAATSKSSTLDSLASSATKLVGATTNSSTPKLPSLGLPPLPSSPLPPLPAPKLPLPNVTAPKLPSVHVPSVGSVTVPDPTSLLAPLGQKSG